MQTTDKPGVHAERERTLGAPSGRWRKLRAGFVVLLVMTMSAGAAETQRTPTAPTVDPALVAAFDALQAEIRKSEHAFTRGQRTALLVVVGGAEAAYRHHHPCMAVHLLGVYLWQAQAQRHGTGRAVAEDLFNEGHRLRHDVLSGLPPRSPCADPRVDAAAPRVHVRASDNQRLSAVAHFGAPRLLTRKTAGEVWTELSVPGLGVGTERGGTPGVPIFRRLVGVPEGAQVHIVRAQPRVAETFRMNLFPLQLFRDLADPSVDRFHENLPPDSAYFDRPFERDDDAYATNARFPSDVCRTRPLGRARDLAVSLLECAAGQYNPVTGTLVLFGSIDFELAFRGGTGAFLTEASLSPFESSANVFQRTVMNYEAVATFVRPEPYRLLCLGSELLILTHPTFRAASDRLAVWKRSRGISTTVVEVNDGDGAGPDTAEEIDAYIENRYATCLVRPAYLLLVGDAEQLPTFILPKLNFPGETLASDYPYTCQPGVCDPTQGDAVVPSFAVGRIPVANATQAEAVVDKILRYEGTPPTVPAFYDHASVAAYFECCRTDLPSVPDPRGWEDQRSFIGRAELFRGIMAGRGFSVERIYTTSTQFHNDYTGDPTPRYFSSGVPLSPPLQPGYAWDGTAQQVTDAFHEGRFLMLHLDHAGTSGWNHPRFQVGDAANLTNRDLLPVVFNMDCSSGGFDQAPVSFAEALLRNPSGGAIGIFAWTRVSSASQTRPVLEGAFDSIWADLLPDFGDAQPRRRLGDILSSSQMRLLASEPSAAPTSPVFLNVVDHLRMYHLIGDPTLVMWVGDPPVLPGNAEVLVGPEGPEIFYGVEGAVITGFQETADGLYPVGRAVVRDGVARLTFQPMLVGVPLQLSASAPNAVSTPLVTQPRTGGGPGDTP